MGKLKNFLKRWDNEVEKRQSKMLKNEELRRQQIESKINKEMTDCTFSPQINKKATELLLSKNAIYDNSIGLSISEQSEETESNTNILMDIPRFEQLYEDAQDRKM